MIIKIEGLPEGQQIKHINVDITFDDEGNAKVKNTMEPIPSIIHPTPQELINDIMKDTTGVTESPIISDISSSPDTFKVHSAPTDLDNRPARTDGIIHDEF